MGNFDKKRAFGIGGLVTVLVGVVAFLANVSEIIQFFHKDDKPEVSTSARTQVVETVIEQADVIEAENVAEVVEEVPPIEAQPSVVYLDSLKVTESYEFNENGSGAIDTIGNTYTNHVMIIGGQCNHGEEDYAVYYLGGQYKTLSGIIAISDSTRDNGSAETLISCDDNVIYDTGIMEKISIPVEFSVNVENCQWLKISKISYGSPGFSMPNKVILSNFKLE